MSAPATIFPFTQLSFTTNTRMTMKHIILIATLLAGCQAANDTGQMEEAMPAVPALAEHAAAVAEAWNTHWSAGDGAAIGEYYADDAVLYAPNAEPLAGKAGITEFWSGLIGTGLVGTLESTEAANDGGLGFETGKYVLEDSAGAHIDHGSYVVVWKYVDGTWKMYRDIWNTNMPAPEM